MLQVGCKQFANGAVYALETGDGMPVETTDTFLPFYTRDAIGRKQNTLQTDQLGDRSERWMIGVSCMSGCPVRCKFCATGKLEKWRRLTADEIIDQFRYVLHQNPRSEFYSAQEHKVNYTRMGEPFLNIDAVREAVFQIDDAYPDTHHYISTIGIKGSDFSWIDKNITLQLSVHSLDEERRDWLIPYKNKMSLKDLGQIRTRSKLKTTVNLTLVDLADFDIDKLEWYFDPKYFFIKLSPVNPNSWAESHGIGTGPVEGVNLV